MRVPVKLSAIEVHLKPRNFKVNNSSELQVVLVYRKKEDINGMEHPISYFSVKFDRHQLNLRTIEKEVHPCTFCFLLQLEI